MTRQRPLPSLRLTALSVALLAAATAASVPSRAQAPPGNGPPPIDRQLANDHPKFLVRASVDRPYRIYAGGDALQIKVRCEEDAYLYVLYQQSDGKLFQIFPNRGQPDNRIKAMATVQVPSLDDAFRWVVGPPFGKEIVKVIASKKPVDALSLPGLKEDRFNPVTVEEVNQAGRQLAKEPPNIWSEHDVAIKTVPRGEPTTPPEAHKRVGVFFGVSEYEFGDLASQISGGKWHLNLKKCHRDAEDMGRVLKAAGRLAEARVFLNREVTRETMRQMITEWLPSVTRPGDTAFIFFSGHGDQIPDDGNDEKDGKDETLDTTEFINIPLMNELMERNKKGQLPPDLAERVRRLEAGVIEVYGRVLAEAGGREAPGAKEKANDQVQSFLIRSTAVSDDEMGHWVQKLDGRHVVVVLDACHSGGMNPTGGPPDKGLKGDLARATGFDFLGGEFARLKDLDQPSLTVLSAASEPESSVERGNDANGMFTGAVLTLIDKTPGPVDVRQALDYSRAFIADKISESNRARALLNRTLPEEKKLSPLAVFVPQLFMTDAQPVYLKPAP